MVSNFDEIDLLIKDLSSRIDNHDSKIMGYMVGDDNNLVDSSIFLALLNFEYYDL